MQWSPSPARAAAELLLGLGLAAVALLLVADWPGRLLVGGAALALLLDGTHLAVARPRLAAGPEGVVVRGWGGARRLPWDGLRVRVRAARHLGFVTRTLELDRDDPDDAALVVLGGRDLGAPLEQVARQLEALRPRP